MSVKPSIFKHECREKSGFMPGQAPWEWFLYEEIDGIDFLHHYGLASSKEHAEECMKRWEQAITSVRETPPVNVRDERLTRHE